MSKLMAKEPSVKFRGGPNRDTDAFALKNLDAPFSTISAIANPNPLSYFKQQSGHGNMKVQQKLKDLQNINTD
jgi:hypothetical protein